MSEPTRLVVGRVRGLHGLDGLVRVEVLTDRPEARFAPGLALHPEGTADTLTVATAAPVDDGPGWRLGFREIRDRASAERLRDQYLEIEVDREAELASGQAWWHEVVGAVVKGSDGRILGTVADVYRAGEAEVYVVEGGPVGSFDLPSVRTVIRDFAPERGELIVDEVALDLDSPVAEQPPKARHRRRFSRHGKGAPPLSADTVEHPPGGTSSPASSPESPDSP